jgi:hypothetical protein
VKTRIDARLRREAAALQLRFSCEQCAHFDSPGDACSLGYPSDMHRGEVLTTRDELEFCKEFDLV